MTRDPRNDRVLILCAVFVAGMAALTFAAAPLYSMFCRATGFAGTTQVADGAASRILDRTVSVRFDTNVGDGFPLIFAPDQREITLKVGETGIAFFHATNTSGETVTGEARYNVTPDTAGYYFKKIQCFCFNEQVFKAHETVEMPVVFFVDPSIADDPALDAVSAITLSYTFYPRAGQTLAQAGAD